MPKRSRLHGILLHLVLPDELLPANLHHPLRQPAKNNPNYINDLLLGTMGGLFGNAGDGLGNYSYATGIGGITSTILGTCSFIQSVLDYIVFSAAPRFVDYIIQGGSFAAVVLCSI
jgi:hypothetical protein